MANQAGQQREKVGIAVRTTQRLVKLSTAFGFICNRLEKHASKSTHAREALANVKNAITLVNQATANLKNAPADLGGTTRGKQQLDVGAIVCIREDKQSEYSDVLDIEDMVGLVVKSVGKKKVKCMTPHGALIFPPRGDLVIDVSAEDIANNEDDELDAAMAGDAAE
jgi:hypothetical protein